RRVVDDVAGGDTERALVGNAAAGEGGVALDVGAGHRGRTKGGIVQTAAIAGGGVAADGAVGQVGRGVVVAVRANAAAEHPAAAPRGVVTDRGVGRRGRAEPSGGQAAAIAGRGVAADGAVGEVRISVSLEDAASEGEDHAAGVDSATGVIADGAVVQI